MSDALPAQQITTALEWSDLVLDEAAQRDIADIAAWVRHNDTLMHDWGLARRLKPGLRCLFYGPPGTGKTLAACLLGKQVGRDVYRVDLAQLVSKYIGDTEKTIDALFEQAQQQNWILFLDEADALFGKRTEVRSANDRAANQQVAYLLQKLEDYPLLAFAESNLRSHLDDAFARRFESVVIFRMPNAEQRRRLWQDALQDRPLAPDVDLRRLAQDYELSGGGIINVLRFAYVRALERDPPLIHNADLVEFARRELRRNEPPVHAKRPAARKRRPGS